MPKPASLMIAIGLPHAETQDEDSLDREGHGGDGDEDSDLATEAVMSILDDLKTRKSSAVRDLRMYIGALDDLCAAFMDRDYHRVGEALSDARDALHKIISSK
jgi:hypothetical protein